jgi:hypothetical protein
MTWDRVLWTGQFRVQVLADTTFCSVLQNVTMGSGVHPASYSVCTRVISLGTKWWGCEVSHSHPTSAEVENDWSYTSPPTLCFHGMARANITSTIYLLLNKRSCLCNDKYLAILIYITASILMSTCPDHYAHYVMKFGAELDNSHRLMTGLWEKCILSEIYMDFYVWNMGY